MSGTLPETLMPVTPKRSDSLALPSSFASPIADRFSRWSNGTHSPSLDIRGARSSYRELENLDLSGSGPEAQGDAGDCEMRRSTKRNSNQSAAKVPQALKRSLKLSGPSQSDEEEALTPSWTVEDEETDDPTSYPNPA
ncbi:hypothetical protein ACEPAG_7792 [Sanghuangporus baumii]